VKNTYCVKCKNGCGGDYCIWCGAHTIPMMLKCPHCDVEVMLIGQFCGNCAKPIQEAIQMHIAKWKEVPEEKNEEEVKCGEV
jgi:predicted amidophosphoribosyltransferase